MSNIIAYADDIVLLAPSSTALQRLIDACVDEACKLQLTFNVNKSKCMIFKSHHKIQVCSNRYSLDGSYLEIVSTFKYLGYFIQDNLRNSRDINETMNRFYREFNMILRKFSFADSRVKLYLFKQCCLQFYGCEMWFANERSLGLLSQFAIGYHKGIKKLLGLSPHESNHYACQEAKLFTFEHFFNKARIFFIYRMKEHPCPFLERTKNFFDISSVYFKEIYKILNEKYQIESLLDNDKDAILSRIAYVQNHESQMRIGIVEASIHV